MTQSRLKPEEVKWIKEHPNEFVDELKRTTELVNNFSHLLEPYRINKNKEGYQKLFKELLKEEEEKEWKKE